MELLPGRFLKDGTDVLANPVIEICNFSISLNKFSRNFKLAKVKLIFKKGQKLMSLITGLSPYSQYFPKLLKSYSRTSNWIFKMITTFSINIYLASISIFSKTFNGNKPIYSNLNLMLMIILRLDVIINTQLLYFYFEKHCPLFMERN